MIEFKENQKPLSPELLKRIEYKIFVLEKSNHPVKTVSDPMIVQRIQKIIDDVVRSEELL